MTKRDVMKLVLDGKRPPYVPWSFGFTQPAHEKLVQHFGTGGLDKVLGNHILGLGDDVGFFEDIGGDCVRDAFGVVWDRSIDQDIGNVKGCVLPEPTLEGYHFPDRSTRASSKASRSGSPPTPTASASTPSASPSTSAPGHCAGWRT